MPRAKSLRFRRLLAGSTGPKSRCSLRCRFWVRIRNDSAFSSRASIRQTAGCGGRAGKKSLSARVASNSSPQSSSSTSSEYYGWLRLQNPGRDDQALDFAGAFVNFRDAGVAIVTFDGILAAVTVAAVDLNGYVRYACGHFAGKEFCDGGVHAETSAGILLPRGLSNEEARSINFRGHVREHELDGLELRNRVAEGHALMGILQGRFECASGDAGGLRGDADAPAVER